MSSRAVDWWQQRSAGEQRALRLLGVVVAGALLAQFMVVPLKHAADGNAERVVAEQRRLVRMQAQAAEIAELARQSARPRGGNLGERVAVALAPLTSGTQPPTVESVAEGQVRVRMPEVAFDALVATLEPLLRDAGARITQFSSVALATPGMVRAELSIER